LLKANIGNDAIFCIDNITTISGVIIDVIKNDPKDIHTQEYMVIIQKDNNDTDIFYSRDIKNLTIKGGNIKYC